MSFLNRQTVEVRHSVFHYSKAIGLDRNIVGDGQIELGSRCRLLLLVLNRLLVWSVCVMVLLSIAVFVGAFAGGAAAWFARGVIADVQRDDEEVDRRVRAEQVRDWAARKANAA